MKRERVFRIKKEAAGQQKSMEKHRQQRKAENSSKLFWDPWAEK
jgi:hypothetical protein